MNRSKVRGFTLIEVMVAVFVFGVLAATAYSTLNATLQSVSSVSEEMARLQQLQRSVQTLQLDFAQLNPRPIREELSTNSTPALIADLRRDYIVELTRSGWANPLNLPRAGLQRVAYRLEENQLIRAQWPVLDRTLGTEPREVILLEDVEEFDIRFLPATGDWRDTWPPNSNEPGPADLKLRPRAVEITMRLSDYGEIRRLIEVIG